MALIEKVSIHNLSLSSVKQTFDSIITDCVKEETEVPVKTESFGDKIEQLAEEIEGDVKMLVHLSLKPVAIS